jgi:type II secretory pathway pseudopilin PulG
MRNRLRRWDDQGETLLELVMAILILGICVVAIGTGIVLSVKMSDVHRKQAVAQEFLHNYAETTQASTYQPCTGVGNYATGLPTPPNGGPWAVSQKSVLFWDGASFTSACPASGDKGLEQVTLRLTSNDGFVDETLDVIVRNVNAS